MAILPVYNIITLPDSNIYFRTDYYKIMTDKVPAVGEKITMIVLKEDLSRQNFKDDSFYPIGVNGFITEIHEILHIAEILWLRQRMAGVVV